jgi:hypothetical protein
VRIKNSRSFYEFTYTTQRDVDGLEARVSAESMDITRRVNEAGDGVALIPQWKEGQVPEGHTGNGAPYDFELFEAQYVLNVPRAYFAEGKLDVDILYNNASVMGHIGSLWKFTTDHGFPHRTPRRDARFAAPHGAVRDSVRGRPECSGEAGMTIETRGRFSGSLWPTRSFLPSFRRSRCTRTATARIGSASCPSRWWALFF